VQKSRLIERIAELLNDKKLHLVGDIRDESAEDVRIVIEPKSRNVDPALMMESLFKLTELESRISLNMNVLIKGRVPKVVGLAEVLREWLDHRRDVLIRRSRYRQQQIESRLEVLGGYLIAYLNLDKVIKIIRTEDEPKPVRSRPSSSPRCRRMPSSTCACARCASSRKWRSAPRTRTCARS
jgi:topoisomerase IV subunit A